MLAGVFTLAPLIYGALCVVRQHGMLISRQRFRGWHLTTLDGKPAMIAGFGYLAFAAATLFWLPYPRGIPVSRLRNGLGWTVAVVAIVLEFTAGLLSSGNR
jgi:hypothetical protein